MKNRNAKLCEDKESQAKQIVHLSTHFLENRTTARKLSKVTNPTREPNDSSEWEAFKFKINIAFFPPKIRVIWVFALETNMGISLLQKQVGHPLVLMSLKVKQWALGLLFTWPNHWI